MKTFKRELFSLLLFTLFAFTAKAQQNFTFYYEDHYYSQGRGYKLKSVDNGQADSASPASVAFGHSRIVTNANSENNTFVENSRPAHRIPNGAARGVTGNNIQQKGIMLKGIKGSNIEVG